MPGFKSRPLTTRQKFGAAAFVLVTTVALMALTGCGEPQYSQQASSEASSTQAAVSAAAREYKVSTCVGDTVCVWHIEDAHVTCFDYGRTDSMACVPDVALDPQNFSKQ